MRTTIVTGSGDAASVTSDNELLARLDARLFCESGFLVTRDNGRSRVMRRNVAVAHARRGTPVTWAAKVRPDVAAVDIDTRTPDVCARVVEALRVWCDAHNVACVMISSGGGAARAHVFAVFDDLDMRRSFRAYVARVRAAEGARRREIDDRSEQPIRALSSAHRRGGKRVLLRAVSLAEMPPFSYLSREVNGGEPLAPSAVEVPEVVENAPPLTRLQRRTVERLQVTGDSSHDSTCATWALRRVGASEASTWAYLVSEARTYRHAVKRGRQWWRMYQWEKFDARRSRGGGGRAARVEQWARWVVPMVARVRAAALGAGLGVARRQSLEHVAGVAAARLGAHGGEHHLPERDLQMDTGQSRTTIRAALRWLVAQGLLVRTATYRSSDDPSRGSNAYKFGVRLSRSQFVPPARHTPPAPGGRALAHTGSAAFSAYTSAWLTGPTSLAHHLTHARGLLPGCSTRQRQLALAAVSRLRACGALRLTAGTLTFGGFTRTSAAAAAATDALRERIASERSAYRAAWELLNFAFRPLRGPAAPPSPITTPITLSIT